MIRLAFDGLANEDLADRIGWERQAVGCWRRRGAEAFRRLVLVECCEKESAWPQALTRVAERPAPQR
jgi:putative transposase